MFNSKLRSLVLISINLSLLVSCAAAKSNFVELSKIDTVSKDYESVQHCAVKPSRAAQCIGLVNVEGNSLSNHDLIIKEARKKAALIGGDFILREDSGTESKTVVNPGYSTYQSSGAANIYGTTTSACASASNQASGYSVGPTVSTYNFPWGVYSVWVYRKSRLGFDYDENQIITRFSLKGNAESAGMRIGDKMIGINGTDWSDDGLPQQLMNILPGDAVEVNLLRDGRRIDCCILALPN